MKQRKKTVSVLVIITIAIVFTTIFYNFTDNFKGTQTLNSENNLLGINFALNFNEGQKYIYNLDFNSSNIAKSFVNSGNKNNDKNEFSGNMEFNCELTMKNYGEKNGDIILGVYLDRFIKNHYIFMGTDLFENKELLNQTFLNNEAILTLGKNGKIKSIKLNNKDNDLFKGIMKMLVSEFQVIINNGKSSWKINESTDNGKAVSNYNVTGEDNEFIYLSKNKSQFKPKMHIEKSNVDYEHYMGEYEFSLNKTGFINNFEGNELSDIKHINGKNIYYLNTFIKLSFNRIENFNINKDIFAEISKYTERVPGDHYVSENAREEALKQRIGNLTIEDVKKGLKQIGDSNWIEERSTWMWRTIGLLKFKPELCYELVDILKDSEGTFSGRAMTLDILASTGHKVAQNVMIEGLNSDSLKENNNEYSLLFQRMTFVKNPEPETLAFINETYNSNKDINKTIYYASANSLGSAAGNMFNQGNKDEAIKYLNNIVENVNESDNEEEIEHLLDALGNAGVEPVFETVASYKNSESSNIRSAVASALRDFETNESEEILFELLADNDANVQHSALRSFSGYRTEPEHLEKIGSLVKNDFIKRDNYSRVVAILSRNMENHYDIAIESLNHILSDNKVDSRLKTRIKKIISSYNNG